MVYLLCPSSVHAENEFECHSSGAIHLLKPGAHQVGYATRPSNTLDSNSLQLFRAWVKTEHIFICTSVLGTELRASCLCKENFVDQVIAEGQELLHL